MRMTLGDAFNRRKKLGADLTSWTNRLKASGHTRRSYRSHAIEGPDAFTPEPGSEKTTTRHYTVDENPGVGAQGLYYNYHTMAKALAHWGEEPLGLPGERRAWWRKDLTRKLVSLQRIDPETGLGYWVNDQGRWWENDPVLATCYCVMALDITLAPSTE